MNPDDCEHELVIDEERHGGAFYAICGMCDSTLIDSGLEDEAGVPVWEVYEKPRQWVMDMGGYVLVAEEG